MDREFMVRRVLLLIVLPMLFFNIGMSIIMGELQKAVVTGEIVRYLSLVFGMSALGLLLTPASLALIIFAVIMESFYVKGIIRDYRLFCLFGSILGLGIYVGVMFIPGSGNLWEIRQLILMFVIHGLAVILVYGRSWQQRISEDEVMADG